MNKSKLFYALIYLFALSFFMASCGDSDCKTCTFDGETQEICEEDLVDFKAETGLDATTIDDLVQLINLLGGSCD